MSKFILNTEKSFLSLSLLICPKSLDAIQPWINEQIEGVKTFIKYHK